MQKVPQSAQLAYETRGQGPLVILLHGLAASRRDWNWLLPELVAAGYSGCAVDLPGHGESLKPARTEMYHYDRLYQTVAEWLERCPASLLLVGHSLGGYISLRFAGEHPGRVRGLVLIDPMYAREQITWLLRPLSKQAALGELALRLAPGWFLKAAMIVEPRMAKCYQPPVRNQMVADLKRASPKIMHIVKGFKSLLPDAAQVQAPVLLLWGENDLTLAPASFPRLAQALPNVQTCAIPGSLHQPHRSHPEQTNPLIIKFLKGLSKEAAHDRATDTA